MGKHFIFVSALTGVVVLTAPTPAHAPIFFEATPRFMVPELRPFEPRKVPKVPMVQSHPREIPQPGLKVMPEEGADHKTTEDKDEDTHIPHIPHLPHVRHPSECPPGNTDPSCSKNAQ
jgi:hypothetical protein